MSLVEKKQFGITKNGEKYFYSPIAVVVENIFENRYFTEKYTKD